MAWLLFLALAWCPRGVAGEGGFLSWADKMLAERQYDFGTPAAGSEAKHSIKISNLYKETVTISEVTASLPEIKVHLDKSVLASRDTAQLEVSLDSSAFGKSTDGVVSMKMTFDGTTYKDVVVQVRAFSSSENRPATTTRVARPGGNWAEQMFSELRHDFGPVARGATAKHVIEVTNLYKEDVVLSNPVSSCGCISPQIDKVLLKSKETAKLTLNLDTIRFSKKRDVTVSLNATFDNSNYKDIRIPITAYIRSDVVFDPGSVQFGVLPPGEAAERRVRVIYAGRDTWTVQPVVRGGNSHLTSQVRELSRGNGRVEYELLVKLAATAPKGPIRDQLVLQTDDSLNPTIPILVDGSIEADLQVTPEVVQFGQLKPGVAKVVNVVIKGRNPFRVEKVECDSSRDCFGVALPPLDKTVHIVGLTIIPPNEPGEFKETFTVTIAGRQSTLAFQAVGNIVAPEEKPAEDTTPVTPDAAKTEVAPAETSPPAESVPQK